MTYELAKKLKDAGFTGLQWMDYLTPVGIRAFEVDRRHSSALPRLIEECGDKLSQIQRHKNGKWLALPTFEVIESASRWTELDEQSTPEEAVAKLWLALHEN